MRAGTASFLSVQTIEEPFGPMAVDETTLNPKIASLSKTHVGGYSTGLAVEGREVSTTPNVAFR